jgi:ribonuclease HI
VHDPHKAALAAKAGIDSAGFVGGAGADPHAARLARGAPALKAVTVYTDGACRGNPGPGGWGALLRYGDHEKMLYGACAQTTNNRMELTAVIEALQALKEPCRVDLYTDSRYVHDGISQWLAAWKQRGWRTAGRKPVKNEDLWRALDAARQRHEVRWHWLRGHAGQAGNERADALANRAIDELLARQ